MTWRASATGEPPMEVSARRIAKQWREMSSTRVSRQYGALSPNKHTRAERIVNAGSGRGSRDSNPRHLCPERFGPPLWRVAGTLSAQLFALRHLRGAGDGHPICLLASECALRRVSSVRRRHYFPVAFLRTRHVLNRNPPTAVELRPLKSLHSAGAERCASPSRQARAKQCKIPLSGLVLHFLDVPNLLV